MIGEVFMDMGNLRVRIVSAVDGHGMYCGYHRKAVRVV